MYAFGVMCWEVMMCVKPFADVDDEMELAFILQNGKGLDCDKLPPEVPQAVVDMIKALLDIDHNKRKTAQECYIILKASYDVYLRGEFDIFFSHPWEDKPFLKFIYRILCRLGYRVWYDKNEMGHRTDKSMATGILQSKTVIICVNTRYQASKACMFELEEARRQNKTVITLVVEPGFFPRKQGGVQVVGSAWADETLKRLCEVSTTLFAGDEEDDNKVPVGLATLAAKYDWKDTVTESMLEELNGKMPPLLKLLRDVECFPSLVQPSAADLEDEATIAGLALPTTPTTAPTFTTSAMKESPSNNSTPITSVKAVCGFLFFICI